MQNPDMPDYDAELQEAGIRVTAIRSLIWRTLRQHIRNAFTLNDMVDLLVTIDKSTVFRTLTLFSEAKLLHLVDDGMGCQKYCVCHCHDTEVHHGHVHLTCVVCRKTWCLDELEIPHVDIPDDFTPLEREYVVKGICAKCKREWGRR
ncbi:MAG: Fur family transcriptional regulator [Alloprevotella sp.]